MLTDELATLINRAREKYGPFSSMQEALGVIRLEYRELEEAIQARDPDRIIAEALDLAAPCLRLAANVQSCVAMRERSGLRPPTTPPRALP